jgi:hypothetical protein
VAEHEVRDVLADAREVLRAGGNEDVWLAHVGTPPSFGRIILPQGTETGAGPACPASCP